MASGSRSASSSCSTLIACLSPERVAASEREVGSCDGMTVEAEAMLCCERDDDGGDEADGCDGDGAAGWVVGAAEGMLSDAVAEAGLSTAEV